MKSVEQFIKEQGITMEVERAPANPAIELSDWDKESSHWFCRFFADGQSTPERFTAYFSMGSAHTEPPTASDVLDSLATDAVGVVNADEFEDWANELGYDTDSRSAERTYKTTVSLSAQLEEWLGHDAYEELLWETERL